MCEHYATPFIVEHIPGVWGKIIAATIAVLCMGPFLRAIIMKKNRSTEFKNLWSDNHFNRGALISLIAFRVGLCMVLVLMVLIPLFPRLTVLMVIIGLILITLIIFSQGFKAQSRKMEARFLENLNYKQVMEEKKAAISSFITHQLKSKEIHIEEIEISPTSPKIGKTLRELNFRGNTRINIVTILRGSRKINIPDANERLYPYDKIILAGADEDIQQLIRSIEKRNSKNDSSNDMDSVEHRVSLCQYVIDEESPMIGKTIAQLRIQEKTECMVICIDRDEESIINFPANFTLEIGDTLLLAGEEEKLNTFKENMDIK